MFKLATRAGFEPRIFRTQGGCIHPMSLWTQWFQDGFEPPHRVTPVAVPSVEPPTMIYTNGIAVESRGLEPLTYSMPLNCSTN